jgi:hypothetical protein
VIIPRWNIFHVQLSLILKFAFLALVLKYSTWYSNIFKSKNIECLANSIIEYIRIVKYSNPGTCRPYNYIFAKFAQSDIMAMCQIESLVEGSTLRSCQRTFKLNIKYPFLKIYEIDRKIQIISRLVKTGRRSSVDGTSVH